MSKWQPPIQSDTPDNALVQVPRSSPWPRGGHGPYRWPADSPPPLPRACVDHRWWVSHRGEEIFKDFNCRGWGCKACQAYLRWKWCKIIVLGLRGIDQIRFLTLTRVEDNIGFNNLIRDLRSSGYRFEYIKFNEIGAKGLFHSHLLTHGDYIPQAEISRRCVANGLGKIVWIEAVYNRASIQDYITKYITKHCFLAGRRKFSYSKGFFPGTTATKIWEQYLKDKFGEEDGRTVLLVKWIAGAGMIIIEWPSAEEIPEKIKLQSNMIQGASTYFW